MDSIDEVGTGTSLDEQDTQVSVGATSSDATRAALIDKLKVQYNEVKAERHEDIDIPGYGGKLFARFRPYEVAQTEKKVKAMRKAVDRGQPVLLANACDTIVDACEQLFVRDDNGNELPIDDTVPVRFEKRLAELLGFDGPHITQARHVVMQLFPTQQSILATSVAISEWLNTGQSEAAEEFLGE